MRDSDRDTERGGRGETVLEREEEKVRWKEREMTGRKGMGISESSCHSLVRLLLKTRMAHATMASRFLLLAKFKPPAILTRKKGLIKAYWK